jgi:broad specificity phosphatase PhoE
MSSADFLNFELLAIRHGITQWNADHRWQGWADIPLSEIGRRQVAVAAHSLAFALRHEKREIRIVSSDLKRAYQTAEAFAAKLGILNIEVDEGLRERHAGEWSGKTTDEIERKWPGMLDAWRAGSVDRLPEGEYEHEFRERIGASLNRAAMSAKHDNALAILVSHGGVIRTLERMTGEVEAPVPNVSGRWFRCADDRVVSGSVLDLLSDELLDASGHTANVQSRGEVAHERTAGIVL